MWMTADVELPIELVEAHSSGDLVLFVGAGASRNPPAGLPLFGELAGQIGDLARQPYPGSSIAIDRFLGELVDGFDVHEHVKRLIDKPESMPNESHRALVRLAGSSGVPRIITTNFDDHLQIAAGDAGVDLGDTYYAPALPVGRDFQGLIHLHGSTKRPARELVLTDHDFGRAYLTDAWATRFLREVFDHFVVLFVGFSHNDPIINYLGMGLPSSTRRFILTDTAQDPRWKRLGITPIAYPAHRDHAASARVIDEWAKRSSMGRLDHRTRIQDIVRGGPPKSPVDVDYLSQMLEDPEGARAFADSASGASWLPWIEKLDVFSVNFSANSAAAQSGPQNEASMVLAHWFSDRYIGDAAYQAAALGLFQRAGQQMGVHLAAAAPWAIRKLGKEDPSAARRWTVILTSLIDPNFRRSLEPYMHALGGRGETNLQAFRQAMHPRLTMRPNYWAGLVEEESAADALPSVELAWPIQEAAADEYWQALKKSGVVLDHRLCSLFENALLSGHELLDAWSWPRSGSNALTFHRSAIEPHSQDQFRGVLDVLVDGVRDCGEEIIKTGKGLIERWWSFKYPLFRRLAVHLLARTPSLDSSAKIQWLLDKDLVFDYHTKHETYAALKTSVRDSSQKVRAALLERIQRGPGQDHKDETRNTEYAKYNVLVWITSADPGWVEARTALEQSQVTNRDFAAREHPDFDHWFESGVWGGAPPASAEELTEMVRDKSPDDALNWLLTQDYSERVFGEPTWEDALGLLRGVAESELSVSLDFWASPILDEDSRADDIRRTLIYGWSRTDLGDHASKVIENVHTLIEDPEAVDAISVFLSEQVGKHADALDSASVVRLREIAGCLWQNHHTSFTHPKEFDPTLLALNSWPGRVASYWVKEISRRWEKDPDSWVGLSTFESEAIHAMLYGSGPTQDAVRPTLAGEVFFMFAADPDFAVDNLFPLFSVEGLERQSWEPYLYHPRWNNRFLERGFLDLTVGAFPRINELASEGFDTQYWNMFASVLAYSDIDSMRRTEILDNLVLERDGSYIVRFIDSLARVLADNQPDEAIPMWDEWIGTYMERRFDGEPRRSVVEELEAWADLVPFLGGRVPAAVELVARQRAGFRSSFLWDSVPPTTVRSYAVPLAQYFVHRLRFSSNLDYMAQHNIADAGNALIVHLDTDKQKQLVEAAAECGITITRREE